MTQQFTVVTDDSIAGALVELQRLRDENVQLRAALVALRDLPASVVACALRPPAEDWAGNAYPHDESACERCIAVADYLRRGAEVDAQVTAALGSAPAEKTAVQP